MEETNRSFSWELSKVLPPLFDAWHLEGALQGQPIVIVCATKGRGRFLDSGLGLSRSGGTAQNGHFAFGFPSISQRGYPRKHQLWSLANKKPTFVSQPPFNLLCQVCLLKADCRGCETEAFRSGERLLQAGAVQAWRRVLV